MKIERIKNLIRKAVDDLYLMELDLLERENNEVTISCKLAQYLFLKFPGYHVDCEYNRHFKDIKRINIDNIRKIIKPDIIIESSSHSREDIEKVTKSCIGRVIVMPYYPEQSSTGIKEKIKDNE